MNLKEADEAFEWAIALHQDYMNAPSGDKLPQLKQAIQLYETVLQVYTQRDFPAQWATTMNNLATAYSDLPTGDRGANLKQAIECYQKALQVRTSEQLPFDSLQTLRNLGNLYYEDNTWQKALESYNQAVTVTEQIRQMALSEAERRRVLEESWQVFERAVLSAMQSTQYSLAFNFTERGKTRNLSDSLWRREVKPFGISESDWQDYQGHLFTAWELERRLSGSPSAEVGSQSYRERGASITVRDTFEELSSLRNSIAEFEANFSKADPDYLPFAPPLEFKDISELSKATNAIIVEFRVTNEGTYVFLVGPEDKDVTPDQVVEVLDFKDDDLRQMLVEFENDAPVDGWLVKYDLFRRRQLSIYDWLECVEQTTRKLYECLLVHVHQRLRQRYPQAKRLILVPNKGLNLLPLHTCWWEDETGERRYLLDKYEITYIPSCQVLKRCQAREQANGSPARSLFAVQNPESDNPEHTLHFSDWEVEEVCKFFFKENQLVLAGSKATEENVKQQISFGEEKFFSCHGRFDLSDVEQSHLALHKDGRLSLPDIVPLDLRDTWLVVMSACETGLTDFRDIIDEYQGLSAAFLVAGAATVVPSLWAMNDFTTTLLMQRFHYNLYERKMNKASSLCEAQRWLRDLSVEEVQELLQSKRKELEAIGVSKQRMSALDAMTAQFHLKDLAKDSQGRPFANPYWWGAFQCVGAGWNTSVD